MKLTDDSVVSKPPFLRLQDTTWAKEQLAKLSLEEKIGQLLHVAAYSNRNQKHIDDLQQLVEEENIGGLIFFQGNPSTQAAMTNHLQSKSKVPLLISIDGEWGLAMRLNDTVAFPYQLALGAIQEEQNSLIYEMGKEIAKQCKALGIHINFAPSVDINNNPANPVIGFRSFGENKHLVTSKALTYMQGMQAEGILACAKHFPGHGDTDSDSHFTLPLINHTKAHLQENELYPFQQLINKGVGSVMTAHLNVPAFELEEQLPSTLSKAIVSGLLQNEMKFEGLVFTDALDMKGVAARYKPGEIETKALLAGNDVLLFTVNVKKAKQGILEALEKGLITESEIDAKCFKQLLAKQWVGLDNFSTINIADLNKDLQSENALQLNQQLAKEAITVFGLQKDFLPVKKKEKVLLVNVFGDPDAEVKLVKAFDASLLHHFKGKKTENKLVSSKSKEETAPTLFQALLENYCDIDSINLPFSEKETSLIMFDFQKGERKIIALHLTGMKTASGFGISEIMHSLINAFHDNADTYFVIFGNIYSLNILTQLKKAKNVLLCYQDSIEMQRSAYNVLVGNINAKGKLPVKID